LNTQKPPPLVAVRVVRAAGDIRGDAALECNAARRDRGAHRTARALRHGLAPGKTDLAHDLRVDRAVGDRGDVRGAVDQGQFAVRRGLRLHEFDRRQLGGEAVAQQLVLAHRETVARRQGQNELGGVENAHDPIVSRGAKPRI
jgi:hypothetical protein